MKTALLISLIALTLPLSAAFEKWTNKEGKTVELSLVEVIAEGEELSGVFITRNGKKATIKISDLNEESAKVLESRKPAPASKFDEVFDGNLEILDGEELKDHKLTKKPLKYYIFYYTASWCGPCRAFTPKLVEFYNTRKNANFEIVLISSDRDENAMKAYAKKNKIPWPQLKFGAVKTFKSKFQHGVRGIPAVIVCDSEGNIVSTNGRNLTALELLVK